MFPFTLPCVFAVRAWLDFAKNISNFTLHPTPVLGLVLAGRYLLAHTAVPVRPSKLGFVAALHSGLNACQFFESSHHGIAPLLLSISPIAANRPISFFEDCGRAET
jgi:hypothetical protein